MQIRFKNWSLISFGAILTLLVCWVMMGVSYASPYGTGSYDSCPYQGCASSPPSTVVTVPSPSGLQVNINLTSGQVIPPQGYTISVTPLNGQTTSISQVDFYIDGSLVQSQSPSEDGIVSWFWNPNLYPGTQIKIVVTAQDSETVTQQFQVTIGSSPAKTIIVTSPSVIQQLGSASGKIIQKTEQAIHRLPQAVKYSLPYFLFVILSGDVIFLVLQIRREIRESIYLKSLVDRERQSGELKKSFIQLVSHYLRTPLTVVIGALDLLNSTNKDSGAVPIIVSLKNDVLTLKSKIEKLVSDASVISRPISETSLPTRSVRPVWRQPLLYLPLLPIGIIAFSFDYLAQHSGSFSVGQIGFIAQIIIYGSLVAVVYLVIRRLLVHRRDAAVMKHLLDNEVNFNHSRDELIEETALELNGSIKQFDAHLTQLPISSATTLLKRGQQQLHDVVDKFVVARQLKESSARSSNTTTQLSTVCAPAINALQTKAQQKDVRVNLVADLSLEVPNPNLLSLVIQTILDNAIEYSPIKQSVEIKASELSKTIRIAITDHGPGIPEAKKFALFQAFSKVEGAEVFDHPGMGFSLYLDKLIMSYLSGDILIEAVAPQGTCVTLILPITSRK